MYTLFMVVMVSVNPIASIEINRNLSMQSCINAAMEWGKTIVNDEEMTNQRRDMKYTIAFFCKPDNDHSI